ncbi:hypothetical protein Dimus_000168 [Dionaea muscipula]
MECNKDEAIRAKEIALRKFMEKDFNGAKKFASKAKSLFPDLEGISQFLMILEVHISAENKVSGQMNWYGILGTSPVADDDTIKKNYRKLALHLHPDKNKFPGADAAFQFVFDAYGVLSDKVKKSAYDQKLNIRPSQPQQRVPAQTRVSVVPPKNSQFQPNFPAKYRGTTPSPKVNLFQKAVPNNGGQQRRQERRTGVSAQPAGENGHHHHHHHTSPSAAVFGGKMQGSSSQTQTGTAPTLVCAQERSSFWTSCHTCRMQYEYLRKFLNKTLLCPHCNKAFKAVETPPPSNLSPTPKWKPQQQHQKPPPPPPSASPPGWKDLDHSVNHFNVHSASAQDRGLGIGRTMGNEKLKRAHVEVSEGSSSGKRRMVQGENLSWSSFSNLPNPFGTVNRGTPPGGIQSSYRPYFNRELSQVEARDMLMHKATVEVDKTVSGWKLEKKAKAAAAQENRKAKEKVRRQKERFAETVDNLGFDELTEPRRSNKPPSFDPSASVTEQVPDKQSVLMNVPDSDFHDFDADRTELCFQDNDVWAAYDSDDGMPRFYALVHEVISSNPFKMRISWLDAKSNMEFGPVEWVSNGFTKTCGEFRVGKHEMNNSLNSFSHKVKWEKGTRGVVRIYPAKGDIWALFKNWSPNWNDETPEDVRHVYEMVEVVETYSEDRGVAVAPLMKAPGFRTVFHRQLDTSNLRRIPKEEMFRFSHQVPSNLLRADQASGAADGCIELDPAATPTELLHSDGCVELDPAAPPTESEELVG